MLWFLIKKHMESNLGIFSTFILCVRFILFYFKTVFTCILLYKSRLTYFSSSSRKAKRSKEISNEAKDTIKIVKMLLEEERTILFVKIYFL